MAWRPGGLEGAGLGLLLPEATMLTTSPGDVDALHLLMSCMTLKMLELPHGRRWIEVLVADGRRTTDDGGGGH